MNTRLVPEQQDGPVSARLSHLRHLTQLARYKSPQGVDVIAGRHNREPIVWPGKTPSVFCIHGYCGNPQDVSVACEAARAWGLSAHAPLLSGHGGDPADLAPLRFEDWLQGILPEFERAAAAGPVIVVGMSLGVLLATELALRAPDRVVGLVAMANPFWVRHPLPGAVLRLVDWLRLPDFGYPTRTKLDLPAGTSAPSYHVQPVHGAISVHRAGQRLRSELGNIRCHSLVLHGARDQVCPVSNAWKFASRLGTSERRVVVLPEARHVLSRGAERATVVSEVTEFLRPFAAG